MFIIYLEAAMKTGIEFEFPVGYHSFHKNKALNFQFNRWYSFGYARYEDMAKAAKNIKTFDNWAEGMTKLAREAETEGRMINAAFYYRAAEFYIPPRNAKKDVLYDKFKSIVHEKLKENGVEITKIPFKGAYLPCLVKKAKDPKGTIVIHGGFDSFMEEFFSVISYFCGKGYDTYVFEGPGQGDARRKHGLAFDYRWEQPTSAVLDYFKLNDVTLLGVSMGGYLCFRAAAFDKRIKRVVASSIAYDYTDFAPKLLQPIVHLFYHKLTNFTNNATLREIAKGGFKSWYFQNLMYMQNAEKPIDAIQYLTEMDAEALHCENISQDILILTGRDDFMCPFKMHKKQVNALINARSVTGKVFYKDSHASSHCQVGNVKLSLDTMSEWIKSVTQ